jgi:hypothetical protein
MKFEIHFEFRASLRKFQDLNFWYATGVLLCVRLYCMMCYYGSISISLYVVQRADTRF